jgi:hypothetical protein
MPLLNLIMSWALMCQKLVLILVIARGCNTSWLERVFRQKKVLREKTLARERSV